MTDLREAIEHLDDVVWPPETPYGYTVLVREAARRWAALQDQEPIDYCTVHQVTSPSAGAFRKCRIVKVRLVEVDE